MNPEKILFFVSSVRSVSPCSGEPSKRAGTRRAETGASHGKVSRSTTRYLGGTGRDSARVRGVVRRRGWPGESRRPAASPETRPTEKWSAAGGEGELPPPGRASRVGPPRWDNRRPVKRLVGAARSDSIVKELGSPSWPDAQSASRDCGARPRGESGGTGNASSAPRPGSPGGHSARSASRDRGARLGGEGRGTENASSAPRPGTSTWATREIRAPSEPFPGRFSRPSPSGGWGAPAGVGRDPLATIVASAWAKRAQLLAPEKSQSPPIYRGL